jgi:hypothetical protein
MRSQPARDGHKLSKTTYPALALIAVFLAAALLRLRDGELAGFLIVPALGAGIQWAYRRKRGAAPTVDGLTWTVAACLTGCAVFSAVIGAWTPVGLAAAALGIRYWLEQQPASTEPVRGEDRASPPKT